MTGTARTARWIAIAAFLIYAATGGGRIVGSDEVTMLELSRALMRGGVAVPEGATLAGRDGRFYTKNSALQAVVALPLVAIGDGAAQLAGLPPARRELAARCVASLLNALIAALLLAAFYVAARRFGIRAPAALAGVALLGFTTPLWVYAKSFMAEPLQALGVLLALAGASFADEPRWRRAGGVGVFLAVGAKLSMLPFALVALLPLRAQAPQRWLPFAIGLGSALLAHLGYNVARFGTPLETGYGAQASFAAYTTPLWVGVYGLLLSSGKGVMWFAPALWLLPGAWRKLHRPHDEARHEPSRFQRALRGLARFLPRGWRPSESEVVVEHRFDDLRRAAPAIAGMAAMALLLYGTFEHWAGDGSFGPRYLVPLLPVAFLLVAFGLQHPSRARRRAAQWLALAGLLVQLGGVGIHFGAQMRSAGDYPYRLALSDPRFMSDAHFNPRFSPILGHWRLLIANASAEARGDAPRLELSAAAPAAIDSSAAAPPGRLGVSAVDQAQLLRALDFWWTYAAYAGLPRLPLQAVALLLLAFGLAAALRARVAARREA
ncbi:MAG: hypothetical protein HOP12_13570 [Candidatus Eisenbacteria bacterium]|uniref:Uncharacterized protein n=1 Tax=Eiseniibacteriota bacterium TaxID=2212470 RepID=A0A849SUY2_UNCEI|nr:hypothetical protein [Candidatus Eisenbacteria bacterium]